VTEQLAAGKGWHGKTVRTLLTRLQKKKVVEATVVDRLYRYKPLRTRDECVDAASTSFLARVFDGAFSPMMAHFVRSSPLSKKDRAELERILSKYDKEKLS
jgi:BlaI family penicillinase repressor